MILTISIVNSHHLHSFDQLTFMLHILCFLKHFNCCSQRTDRLLGFPDLTGSWASNSSQRLACRFLYAVFCFSLNTLDHGNAMTTMWVTIAKLEIAEEVPSTGCHSYGATIPPEFPSDTIMSSPTRQSFLHPNHSFIVILIHHSTDLSTSNKTRVRSPCLFDCKRVDMHCCLVLSIVNSCCYPSYCITLLSLDSITVSWVVHYTMCIHCHLLVTIEKNHFKAEPCHLPWALLLHSTTSCLLYGMSCVAGCL